MAYFSPRTAADPAVFFKRGDPNDVRLGETVFTAPERYAEAEIVLLGLPQDEGVARNKGRLGAKDAPNAIRRCLYKYVSIEGLRLFDAGDTRLQGTLEATHALHRDLVRQMLRDGKCLIVLGGGNDTSYPDCSALALETEGAVWRSTWMLILTCALMSRRTAARPTASFWKKASYSPPIFTRLPISRLPMRQPISATWHTKACVLTTWQRCMRSA